METPLIAIERHTNYMPLKPRHECYRVNCHELTRETYCPGHTSDKKQQSHERNKRYDTKRGTAAQRGYGGRWQRARETYLRSHPLCVECKTNSFITPSTTVDHIVPHRGDIKLFWDTNNWQALCKMHHDKKTARGE